MSGGRVTWVGKEWLSRWRVVGVKFGRLGDEASEKIEVQADRVEVEKRAVSLVRCRDGTKTDGGRGWAKERNRRALKGLSERQTSDRRGERDCWKVATQLGSRRNIRCVYPQGMGDEAQVEMFWRQVVLILKLTLDGAGTKEDLWGMSADG